MKPLPRKIILASASPRRRELLDQLGVRYEVVPADIPEIIQANESAEGYVRRVAAEKSFAVSSTCTQHLPVLAADTEVILDDDVLGKPVDENHATEMLLRLSDREHWVLSAVSLRWGEQHWEILSSSRVLLRAIHPDEIAAYWATGEPGDKAGAYAIQGLGALFVARLSGSYSGVMGLPLMETAELLAKIGFHPLRHGLEQIRL